MISLIVLLTVYSCYIQTILQNENFVLLEKIQNLVGNGGVRESGLSFLQMIKKHAENFNETAVDRRNQVKYVYCIEKIRK